MFDCLLGDLLYWVGVEASLRCRTQFEVCDFDICLTFYFFCRSACWILEFGCVMEAHGGVWMHTDAWQMHMNTYGCTWTHMDAYSVPGTRYQVLRTRHEVRLYISIHCTYYTSHFEYTVHTVATTVPINKQSMNKNLAATIILFTQLGPIVIRGWPHILCTTEPTYNLLICML